MAIQHRRGTFKNFDPSRLLPGEWAVVLDGDSAIGDGQAVYICFSPGRTKRVAFTEDAAQFVQNAADDVIAQLNSKIEEAIKKAEAAAQSANEAAGSANGIIESTKAAGAEASTQAQAAKDAADRATQAASDVEAATSSANDAAKKANDAAASVDTAKQAATDAASKAESAAASATQAASDANGAAEAATTAAGAAMSAAGDASAAAQSATEAAGAANKAAEDIQSKADAGDFNGATFIPDVSEAGIISWDNDKSLPNPESRNIMGPQGPKGDGLNILDSYDTYEDMVAAHPTGESAGEGYLAGGHYYVWNGSEWKDGGALQGPPGKDAEVKLEYDPSDGNLYQITDE